MTQRVGTCSLCGGDVMGFRGAWNSILPPPPDVCAQCGATRGGGDDVIEMRPGPRRAPVTTTTTNTISMDPDAQSRADYLFRRWGSLLGRLARDE